MTLTPDLSDPERLGFPSTSPMERYQKCPASFLRARGLPPIPPEDYTNAGTVGHWLRAIDAPDEMVDEFAPDDATAWAVKECKRREWDIIQPPAHVERETRMWGILGGVPFSGKADAIGIYSFGDSVIVNIVDNKLGRNEVAPSPTNLQLRSLAVLAWLKYDASAVGVDIIHPWSKQQPRCLYQGSDLQQAKDEIERILLAITREGAPVVPGEEQCRYCPARRQCPEFLSAALAVVAPLPQHIEMTKGAWAIAAAAMPGEKLAAYLTRLPMAKAAVKAIEAEAKARLKAGVEVPGYELAEPETREPVNDLPTIWARLEARGVLLEDFMGCLRAAKGDLRKVVKAATGLKGKALEAEFDSIVAGCVGHTECKPKLKKVGGAQLEDEE